MGTYNLCSEQKYEKYQILFYFFIFFFYENFHFLVVKFSIYLNRRVFVMERLFSSLRPSNALELVKVSKNYSTCKINDHLLFCCWFLSVSVKIAGRLPRFRFPFPPSCGGYLRIGTDGTLLPDWTLNLSDCMCCIYFFSIFHTFWQFMHS